MPARQEVTKDVTGQRIYFYPQEGRPTATPTVEILDASSSSTISAAADTNVTQDSVNTTVGTQNAVGDTSLALASIANVAWRDSYLITNTALQREWVRVMGVDTGNTEVDLDEPLQFIHDTSATFQSTTFYYTLQSGDVDELGELFRARAVYTVGGRQYKLEVPFDVVLVEIESPLTAEFIRKRRPGVMAQEPQTTRGTDFLDLREVAWERVMSSIRSAGTEPGNWRPSLLKTPDDVDDWALAEFDLLAHQAGVDVLKGDWDPQMALEELRSQIRITRSNSLRSLEWMDVNDDDSRADDEHRPSVGPDFMR